VTWLLDVNALSTSPTATWPDSPRTTAIASRRWMQAFTRPSSFPSESRAALAAGGIVNAADVAGQFKHAKTPRVEEILDTLVALGHARRTDDGYAPA
jgi:hypothetical protein